MAGCPTCGAPTHPLDPIGGVDGPAVVECEAGHQTGAPVDVSALVTAVDIGGGPRPVGAVTFTPNVTLDPPVTLVPGRYQPIYHDDSVTFVPLGDDDAATPGMVARASWPDGANVLDVVRQLGGPDWQQGIIRDDI